MNSSLINRLFSPKSSSPASVRTSNNSNKYDDDNKYVVSASSYYQKTVCLYNWWLVKANKDFEGKRLAVAGFTSRELQAMRVFTSAPIVKSYNPFSLETSDGIYIIIKGLINKSRTMENGFSSEVFSHFNLGFHRDWEAYADKYFMKEIKSAAAAESDAGIANSNSNAIPMDEKNVKGKSKRDAGDTPANASRSSVWPSHASDHIDIGNTNNQSSTIFPPLTRCDVNNVSSLEDNLAVPGPAEPSSYHISGSSESMANVISRRKGNTGTATKSKTKESSRLDDITSRNVASGESSIPKGSDVGSSNLSLYPAVSLGNSKVVGISSGGPTTSEKQIENDKSECGLQYENENSSSAFDSDPVIRSINVNGKSKHNTEDINKYSEFVFESDSPSHAADLNGIGNKKNHATKNLPPLKNWDITNVCSLEENLSVPAEPSSSHMPGSCERIVILESKRKGNNGTATKSKTRERASLEGITIRNVASRESPVPKGSDVDNGNPSNLDTVVSLGDSEVALRISSSEPKTSERQKGNDNSNDGLNYENKNRKLIESLKGNKERLSIICGFKPEGSEMGSVLMLSDETKNIEENDKLRGELQEPSHSTLVRDKLKARGCRKKSKAGITRQNKNNSSKSPRGPVDMNHDHNLKTAFDERERNVSLRKKAQRKINFDAPASPHTQERKEKSSIVSPESLSLKRSRSGRLLVPSLDFWRNQIAVYDAGRKITGIQEGLDILKSPKEPPKKRRRKN